MRASTAGRKQYNLATIIKEKLTESFPESFPEQSSSSLAVPLEQQQFYDFSTCLINGWESNVYYGKYEVLDARNSRLYYVYQNKLHLWYDNSEDYHGLDQDFYLRTYKKPDHLTDPVVGLVVKKSNRRVILLNGDIQEDDDYEYDGTDDVTPFSPLISFGCLEQLLGIDVERLGKKSEPSRTANRILLLDFTEETRKELSPKDRTKLRDAQKNGDKFKGLKSPEMGFTLMQSNYSDSAYWHRSGSILFQDTKTKKHYLVGQDEGTYFGVELAGKPKTIANAFLDLIPKSIRHRLDLKRQGEWFLIPVPEKDIPKLSDRVLDTTQSDSSIHSNVFSLNRLTDEDHHHTVKAGDTILAKDGTVYFRNLEVWHDEHATLHYRNGWCKFMRNTAIRSVSQEGVD